MDATWGGIGIHPTPERTAAWNRLVERVRTNDGTLRVLSSEFLADATDATARAFVEAFECRVHVLITLRPLPRILASWWQQYAQVEPSVPYEEWLDEVFNRTEKSELARRFLHQHDHASLIRRWAGIAGESNVTVLVADDSDPDRLLREFEKLIGLPERLLGASADHHRNRSLTAAEIDLVRRCYDEVIVQHGWPGAFYDKYFWRGALERMRRREPAMGEARVATPAWAQAAAGRVAEKLLRSIASTPVRIVGDTGTLLGSAEPVSVAADPLLPPEAAVRAIIGILEAVMREHHPQGGGS